MFPENELRFLSFGFPAKGAVLRALQGWLFISDSHQLVIFCEHVSIRDHISRNSIIKTKWLNKSNKFALRKGFYHAHTDHF
jgi:hypothetical protein